MIFSSVKEGILELLYGLRGASQTEIIAGQLGAHLEPKAGATLGSFKKEDLIVSSCHLIAFGLCTMFPWG